LAGLSPLGPTGPNRPTRLGRARVKTSTRPTPSLLSLSLPRAQVSTPSMTPPRCCFFPAAPDLLRRRRDGALVRLLALYLLLLLDLFFLASSTRPQLRIPRGHRWFWPPPAGPSASAAVLVMLLVW
jgi:hypothetical protein